MANKIFEVEFDGRGTYTLGELVSEGFFGEDGHELTITEVDALAIGQSLNFAGGAAPVGTITRLGCGFQGFWIHAAVRS